jgi:flavin reductase (DIM6/NTAB) family NADH-FMN oxidoreductase RutF
MMKSLGAKTIAFPVPVWVIGTYDGEGKPNVMTASWAGVCCSKPPCVNISLRKATHSYAALADRRAFTVSVPSVNYVREADFIGRATGRVVDKFDVTGLTPVRAEHVDAPYVAEFPLVLECRIIHDLEIGLHTLFVGEIQDVKVDESVLGDDGQPDVERLAPYIYTPEIRSYFALGECLGPAFKLGEAIG